MQTESVATFDTIRHLRQAAPSRRADQETEHAGHLQRMLIEELPVGLVLIDQNGIVQDCNSRACEQLRTDPRQQCWSDIVQKAFRIQADSDTDAQLRSGQLVQVRTCPMKSGAGQIVTLTDVTAENAYRENLSRKKRLEYLGTLMASLAHQIRTPLMAAMLYASQTGAVEDEEKKNLKSSLRHIEQLVNDMLLYTSNGKMTFADTRVNELMHDFTILAGPVAELGGCQLNSVIDDGDTVVHINRNAVLGALQNLVSNSVSACHGQGNILVHAHLLDDGGLEILVTDNGRGVPREQQAHIFEPFYTSRQGRGGTGLGLAVVRNVMNKHDGEIWLESIPGLGSTFGLVFPVTRTRPFAGNLSSGRDTPCNAVS